MNIYTATKWERRSEMNTINRTLESLGHRITHDWTVWEEENPSKDTESRRHAAAMLDFAGVMQSELVIFWDHPEANGARWEAGMAIGAGIPVWIVEYHNDVVFDGLPEVSIVESWPQAYMRLGGTAFGSTLERSRKG
jgi:nucleoside 2-deoxyribosyltransferase